MQQITSILTIIKEYGAIIFTIQRIVYYRMGRCHLLRFIEINQRTEKNDSVKSFHLAQGYC